MGFRDSETERKGLNFSDDEDDISDSEIFGPVKKRKEVSFKETVDEKEIEDIEDEEDEEHELEDIEEEDEPMEVDEMQEEDDEEVLTNFAKEQKKFRQTIQHLEEENLAPRSWELAGEVRGADRDQDELLEKFVEVDYKAKQAPQIDEDVNQRIESIVIQRIKDKVNVFA